MNAISYIEYSELLSKMPDNEIEKILNWYNIKLFHKKGFKSALEFYSQPFKPELITALFEGWEYADTIAYTDEGENEYKIEIYVKKPIGCSYDYDYNYDYEYDWERIIISSQIDYRKGKDGLNNVPLPDTINEFIRDCQRAGIELEFKQ